MIQHVLDEKKNFKDETNLNTVCWNIYKNICSLNPHGAIKVLELGEKTDTKSQQYNWRLEIGKMYEVLMNQTDNVNIKANFCILASENYKKAGEKSKAETLLKEYEKFTADFEYFKHSEEIENYSQIIEKVFEIPSWASANGSFATEASEATAPLESLPCIGLAPGASGTPALLPSGVLPVFFP